MGDVDGYGRGEFTTFNLEGIMVRELVKKFESWFESELECEIEKQRNDLREILEKGDTKKLRELATKVGASTFNIYKGYGQATDPELTHNIYMALQTKSMMAAVKATTKYVSVTFILALITLGSLIISILALIATFLKK
jgi:hypothetical protein